MNKIARSEIFLLRREASSRSINIKMQRVFLLGILMFLPFIGIMSYSPESFYGQNIDDNINAVFPIIIILVCSFVAFWTIKILPTTILTPHFLFAFQSIVFFGFGPLVEIYGNEATLNAANNSVLFVTPEGFAKSNLLSVVGISLVWFGFYLHHVFSSRIWNNPGILDKAIPSFRLKPVTLAVLLIVFGLALKYLIVHPARWGIIDIVVPGIFSSINLIADVGFALVIMLILQGHKRLLFLFILTWPLHFCLTWITFSKFNLISAMLFPLLGLYLGGARVRTFLSGILVMFLLYTISQPYVHYGRQSIQELSGVAGRANYYERIKITFDYFSEDKNLIELDEDETWWRRLNYSNVQTAAINAYDSGRSINSFRFPFVRFIPRVIWPDKPIIEGAGILFNEFVSGRKTSSLGLTIYGDAYWQFGWLGVFLIMPIFGVVFSFFSIRAIYILQTRKFIYVPVVLLVAGISLLGPVSFILDGNISPAIICMVYLWGTRIAVKSLN